MEKFNALVSTFFGVGKFGKMPGTMGSAAAVAIAVLIPIHWTVIAATAILGIYCSDRYSKLKGEADPSEVVIDEVVGMWISMWGLPVSYGFPAFVLFRLVDILKPFPVNLFERLPGGFGIMADDIAAGVLVRLILWGLHIYMIGGNLF